MRRKSLLAISLAVLITLSGCAGLLNGGEQTPTPEKTEYSNQDSLSKEIQTQQKSVLQNKDGFVATVELTISPEGSSNVTQHIVWEYRYDYEDEQYKVTKRVGGSLAKTVYSEGNETFVRYGMRESYEYDSKPYDGSVSPPSDTRALGSDFLHFDTFDYVKSGTQTVNNRNMAVFGTSGEGVPDMVKVNERVDGFGIYSFNSDVFISQENEIVEGIETTAVYTDGDQKYEYTLDYSVEQMGSSVAVVEPDWTADAKESNRNSRAYGSTVAITAQPIESGNGYTINVDVSDMGTADEIVVSSDGETVKSFTRPASSTLIAPSNASIKITAVKGDESRVIVDATVSELEKDE